MSREDMKKEVRTVIPAEAGREETGQREKQAEQAEKQEVLKRDAIDLGTMNIFSLFSKFFIPTLFGMLSISAVTVVDGIFVGHGVGSDGIAAINICIPLLMVIVGVGLMVGAGCSVVSSIQLSRGKKKVARLNVSQALAFVTAIGIVFTALVLIFPKGTLRLLGVSEHLMPLASDYIVWFIPAVVFQLWTSVSLFVIRLDGAPRLAMWCSLTSALVNVFLDWLFIFPLGMGIMGAALASTISIFIGGTMALVYLAFFARTLRLYPIKLTRNSIRLTLRNIGYQCTIGSSGLLGEATMAMLMFIGNRVFMKYLGDDGVGAFGVACYYLPFVFMAGNAIAQSAQPIISYNFGQSKLRRVHKTQVIAIGTAVVCGVVAAAAFRLFPKALVGLFIGTEVPAAQIAIAGFPAFSLGFIFFLINLTAIGYYQSVERTLPSVIFSLLRGLVFLLPSFFLMPRFGVPGIWLAMSVSEGLTTVVIVIYWLASRHRREE